MTPGGRIAIDLFPGAAAKIASSRPLNITRQFSGQRPQDLVRTVSVLFAVCMTAQSIAAAEAFEDALGIEASATARRVRALLVLNEIAREHALRILMDWPGFLGAGERPASAAALKTLMQIIRDFALALDRTGTAMTIGGEPAEANAGLADAVRPLKDFLEMAIFGEDLACWNTRSTEESFAAWARPGTTPARRLAAKILDCGLASAGSAALSPLPGLDRTPLLDRLFAADADAFIARPEWQGQPCETSPLTRQRAHPLVAALSRGPESGLGARLTACLVELAAIPDRMLAYGRETGRAPAQPDPADGFGLAQIEAARGRLIHAVRMDGDRAGCYRILAPTEWNFHPQGAAALGLARLASARCGDSEALAALFVMAVDPCTGYEVRVH